MANPQEQALTAAAQALRHKSRSVWNQYIGQSRLRELVAWTIALLTTIGMLIAISLANTYASTIQWVNTTNVIDHAGEVVARTATLAKESKDDLSRHVCEQYLHDMFTIWNSKPAMQNNANEAFTYTTSPTVRAQAREYWSINSPLQMDGTWTAPSAERNVQFTSFVARVVSDQGSEYEVEFQTTDVLIGSGIPSQPQFYKADMQLNPIGAKTGDNPLGLSITHLSYSEIK